MSSDGTHLARVALVSLAAAAALVMLPSAASAQRRRPTPRTAPIEIRGQVPTPQVVTVRPRETPEFSRQVLVPNFYDRQFWPTILPGYALVARRALAGPTVVDSVIGAVPRTGTTAVPLSPTPAQTPAPTSAPTTPPADSTPRPPGTAPAR